MIMKFDKIIAKSLFLFFIFGISILDGCSKNSSKPIITSLEPSSGPEGVAYPIEVTIHGSGFTSNDNIVYFLTIANKNLPSTDGGTKIVFYVPKEKPSSGEVPPMVLPYGDYEVSVVNVNGRSNVKTFTLSRPK